MRIKRIREKGTFLYLYTMDICAKIQRTVRNLYWDGQLVAYVNVVK